MANRFISQETTKLDLGDGDWVKIRKNITYWDMASCKAAAESDERGKRLVLEFITDWNLKDEDGKPVPCVKENILLLDDKTLPTILYAITDAMEEEQKKNGKNEEEVKKKKGKSKQQ